MSARLTYRLTVDRAEGALERVLSVVRRRRLGLERFTVRPAGEAGWDIAIEAAGSESEGGLALRQFSALIDVRAAVMDGPASG